MAVTGGFRDFVLEQLEPIGDVLARSMFGGVGLYSGDLFFGILAGDVLYLKVDGVNRPDYEAAGARPFKPYPHRPATMQYYEVPLQVLEDGPALVEWARRAVAAAGRASRAKATRERPRRKSARQRHARRRGRT